MRRHVWYGLAVAVPIRVAAIALKLGTAANGLLNLAP
jgi:hypothetical protein